MFVGAGNGGGVEIGANQPFGRAGFFDFGNHRRLPGGMFGMNSTDKIAQRRLVLRLCAQFGQRQGGLGGGHFVGFGGQNAL